MNRQHFIKDVFDYEALQASLSRTLHADRRLPSRVFAEGFKTFRFLEFDLMLTENFWDILTSLATASGDSEVIFTAHDPDPDAYYFAHFHRYGMLGFNRTNSRIDYYNALREEPPNSPADALLYATNVASWFGDAKKWAFWGERDLGIGVAAVRDASLSWPEVQGIRWFDVDNALSDLVAINFRDELVPREFSEELRRNYQAG